MPCSTNIVSARVIFFLGVFIFIKNIRVPDVEMTSTPKTIRVQDEEIASTRKKIRIPTSGTKL